MRVGGVIVRVVKVLFEAEVRVGARADIVVAETALVVVLVSMRS